MMKKLSSDQVPQKYIEEEILIENPKTGQIIRKIVRIYHIIKQLNKINTQGQSIIGCRIVATEYSTEQLDQVVIKEQKLERILENENQINMLKKKFQKLIHEQVKQKEKQQQEEENMIKIENQKKDKNQYQVKLQIIDNHPNNQLKMVGNVIQELHINQFKMKMKYILS